MGLDATMLGKTISKNDIATIKISPVKKKFSTTQSKFVSCNLFLKLSFVLVLKLHVVPNSNPIHLFINPKLNEHAFVTIVDRV